MVCTEVNGENGGGGEKLERPKKGPHKPQETVAESQPFWGMLYADDAGIVSRSRNSLVKTMSVIVAVCTSFGLTVLQA